MNDKGNEQIMEKLNKELLLSRVFSMISSVLIIFLLISAIIMFVKYQESESNLETYMLQIQTYLQELETQKETQQSIAAEEYNKTIADLYAIIGSVDWNLINDSIASVDWKMLNDSIAGIDWKMLSDSIASVDWKMLSDNIAGVDWEMLSDNIASVDWEEISKQLAALDVEAINDVIEELDTKELSLALANMNSAIEKLKGIIEMLSNIASKWGLK